MRWRRTVVVVLLLGAVLASCTSTSGPAASTSPESPSARVGAGGTLRVGLISDQFALSTWCPMLFCGRTYDPQSTTFVDAFELNRCCFMRTLLTYDGTSVGEGGTVLRPDMAEALPDISADGLTWTFHLRSGVHYAPPFQDTEITAGDYVRSLERAFTPAGPEIPWANGGTIGGYFTDAYLANVIAGVRPFTAGKTDHVAGLQAPDPHTLVVHLTKPVGDLGYRLALPGMGPIPANPARPGDPLGVAQGHDFDYGDVIVSSGPYMFAGSGGMSFAPPAADQALPSGNGTTSATLVRNPSWSPANDPVRRALPDRIEFVRMDTPDQAVRMIRSGRVDVALNWGADARTTEGWLGRASLRHRVTVAPADGERYLFMNLAMPPFDDIHVRRAVDIAVDRQAVADALQGGGQPEQHVFTHLALDGYEDNLLVSYAPPGVTPDGDLAAAEREMRASSDDANHDGRCDAAACSGIRLLVRRADPQATAAARLIAGQLRPLGIAIIVTPLGQTAFNASYGDPSRHVELRMDNWFKDFPSASTFFPLLLSGESIGTTNQAMTGASRAELRRDGYTVSSVPNVDARIAACIGMVFQAQTRCWAALDQYLSEQVVPWVPLTQQVEGWLTSSRVRGFTVDASVGIPVPALDRIGVAGPARAEASPSPPPPAPAIPDGTYRSTISTEDITRFGGPHDDVGDAGTYTLVMRGGRFFWHQRGGQIFNPLAVGTYSGSGRAVTFTIDAPANYAATLSPLTWRSDGDGLAFHLDRCTGPAAHDRGFCGYQKAL
ncbi:MAG TPA: ABC transporter substrate-binding protein, partial [Actinomycetota bacterium]